MSRADLDGYGPDQLVSDLDVSRETLEQLIQIVDLLETWRFKHNLIGPNEMGRIWRRHVLDSLQLLTAIPRPNAIVDLGSGAGFPGLILAAALRDERGHVTMVESVGKKCAFLREAIGVANLPAKVRQGRVEKSYDMAASCITARAFAPLPRLMAYAEPWLLGGAEAVLLKGKGWEEELTQAQECWKFAYDVIPSLSGDGVVLTISEVSRGD